MGILEKILKVETGSVTYKVVGGPFPASDHLGVVSFEMSPDLPSTCIVTWRVTIVVNTVTSILTCGLMGKGISFVLRKMLASLAHASESDALLKKN